MIMYIAVYTIISAIILLFSTKGNWKEWLFKFTFIMFLPIIGWLIPSIWPKKLLKNDTQYFQNYMEEQNEDIEIEFINSQNNIEREKELDIISVEEALVVNDYAKRRQVVIDVLKEDALQYIEALKAAVTNDDTETSHYAVTAVIEIKRNLTLLLQKLSVEFNNKRENAQIANHYAEVIKEYLNSGFIDNQTTKQYQATYIHVLQQIIQNDNATENTYIEKIAMELKVNNLLAAETTAKQFKLKYPLCEEVYLSSMKIYFEMRAFDLLQQELQQLKDLPIILSNSTLKIVRYWSGVTNVNERSI